LVCSYPHQATPVAARREAGRSPLAGAGSRIAARRSASADERHPLDH